MGVLRRLAEQSHILLLGLEEAEVLFKTREQEKLQKHFSGTHRLPVLP